MTNPCSDLHLIANVGSYSTCTMLYPALLVVIPLSVIMRYRTLQLRYSSRGLSWCHSWTPTTTVPPDIAVTTISPDILILHDRKITIAELTVSWNSVKSIQMARMRKMGKKQLPTSSVGPVFPWILHQIPHPKNWVPGALHPRYLHYSEGCCSLSQGSDWRAALIETAKAATSGSYQIFLARKSPLGHCL
jgi:hypothetical protein